uniref:Uncharacterized protein n=1 Tax=Rhipicephalus appendiculatus TaxID=34631 RepID=A0A131YFK3_RHIAP
MQRPGGGTAAQAGSRRRNLVASLLSARLGLPPHVGLAYLDLSRIFLRLRFNLRIRFLRHLALMSRTYRTQRCDHARQKRVDKCYKCGKVT